MELQDKTIAITGAARGLGAAIAKELATAGANIAVIDIDQAAAKRAASTLPTASKPFHCDISQESAVDALFGDIDQHFGGIHGLVNNAGIIRDGLLVKAKDRLVSNRLSLSDWQQVIDVNLTGTFLCGRAAAAQMIKRGHQGLIVNVSSISRHGNRGQSNYSATKAAVAALAVCWSQELAPHGIRAMSLSPGFTETEMVASMRQDALDKLRRLIPSQRLGTPDEMARTVRFMFENDYLTGRDIGVDGGLRL